MNVFVTSSCPIESARALDDKRLVKMPLESAQLLSTALYNLGYWRSNLYRPTHRGHPCTKWAGRSRGNFSWLVRHGLALCDEYRHRYYRVHKSRGVILLCQEAFKDCPMDELSMTPFPNCTTVTDPKLSTIEKYRRYLVTEKWAGANPRWTNRERPEWA